MTEYRTINAKKRNLTILAFMPEVSDSAVTVVNNSDTRVTRNGDTRVTRNGDTRVAHNLTTNAYTRLMRGTKKRNFIITAKVTNG